jgi:hypothetical protein
MRLDDSMDIGLGIKKILHSAVQKQKLVIAVTSITASHVE